MPLTKTTALISFIFVCTVSYSQADFPEFGLFSSEEINLKQCPFDPEAEAIILLDKAVVTHDDQYHLIIERRIRIKILNEKAIDRGDISIPFYNKDDIENISKITAYTFNFDERGKVTTLQVDKKSIHTEKTTSYFSQIKFAMPALKVGSIIEYHYVSTMKHYGYLDEWKFQSDLPTLKSNYFLQIIPGGEFAYTIQKKPGLSISVKPMPDQGKVYYEMNNIPALRIEPYMDAPRDYVQKVIFQLSGYTTRFGNKQEVNTTWKSLAYELMTEKDFGSQLDKDLKIDELKAMLSLQSSQQDKIKFIYDYVNKNITWNGYDTKYAPDGLKAVWDRKKGGEGEINLLLINLLKTAGIETYPVLAAERDFGKVDTTYPFIDRFNKIIAFAIADGKHYVLDATQENCPVGLTPYPLLNTTGFLVDKKKYNLIKIAPGNKTYRNIVTIKGTLDSKGLVTAEANVKSYEYARQLRLNAIKNNRGKFVKDNFEKPYDGLTIDSFLIIPPQADSIPLELSVKFKQQLNESGGLVFFNPNLFTGLEKNQFISSIRFTNVNFGFPYNTFVEQVIKLPAGTKIDLPEDKIMDFENNKITVLRNVRFENGDLKITIHFLQTTTLVPAEAYPPLKDFYKKMIDMLNEPLVLKLPG